MNSAKQFSLALGSICKALALAFTWFLLGWAHWFLAVLVPVYLLVAFIEDARQRRRHRFEQTGHCVQCGYDLRASKLRCPECGTPFPSDPAPDPEPLQG